MHDRDLPGWTAEADEAELEPEAECFGEGDGLDWRGMRRRGVRQYGVHG
jgi:hypothetical protein